MMKPSSLNFNNTSSMANGGGGSVALDGKRLEAKPIKKTYYQTVDDILKNIDSNFFNKFSQLKSDAERFEFVYSTEVIRRSLKRYVLSSDDGSSLDYAKNEGVARTNRLKGNEHFKSKEFNVALRFYNECIRNARFPVHFKFDSDVEGGSDTNNFETTDILTNNEPKTNQTSVKQKSNKCCSDLSKNSAGIPVNDDASEMALGLANRSAAMLKLNRYTDCIQDALAAIRCGYPIQQRYKLWERMATCHERIGHLKEAEISYKTFEESLDCSDLSKAQQMCNRKTAADGLARCKAHMMKEVESNDLTDHVNSDDISIVNKATNCRSVINCNGFSTSKKHRANGIQPDNCQYTRNCHIPDTGIKSLEETVKSLKKSFPLPPASSNSVKFCYSKDFGRYASASRDIKTGEVILIDKTFAKTLDLTLIGRRCQYCFVTVRSDEDRTFPCPSCRAVAYCSETCARLSHTLDRHDLECPILQDLQLSQTGTLASLVTKLLFNVGAKRWTDIANSSRALSGGDVTNSDVLTKKLAEDHSQLTETTFDQNSCHDALVLYHLLSHSDKRSPMELLQFTILAVWIVILIKEKTSFFATMQETPESTSSVKPVLQSQQNCSQLTATAAGKDIDDPVIVIGGIALRFLQIITCNGIEISETLVRKTLGECHPNPIGLALYPTASLFNHSCDSDLEFIFDRDVCYARCIRAVPAGASISVDYGYLFYVTRRDERMQSLLKQYFFNCQCPACENHWPVKSNLKKDPLTLANHFQATDVKHCLVRCPACQSQLEKIVENKDIATDSPAVVPLNETSKNEPTKSTKRRKKKKLKSIPVNLPAVSSDEDLNCIKCCPESCQNGDANNNDNINRSVRYKCSSCDITYDDQSAILGIPKLDPKLKLEQVLTEVRQMKISSNALRCLELYLDYRYLNFSSTPTYEMITCLSTLKQCYRLFGNTSC